MWRTHCYISRFDNCLIVFSWRNLGFLEFYFWSLGTIPPIDLHNWGGEIFLRRVAALRGEDIFSLSHWTSYQLSWKLAIFRLLFMWPHLGVNSLWIFEYSFWKDLTNILEYLEGVISLLLFISEDWYATTRTPLARRFYSYIVIEASNGSRYCCIVILQSYRLFQVPKSGVWLLHLFI
jgi:hypothetical protein